MRRCGAVFVVLALALAGCGGDGDQRQDAPAAKAGPSPAARRDACEQAADTIRREHPGAHVGECNSGTGTLTVP